MTGIRTYRFPHKCLKCSLHFNVYSDNEDWSDRYAFCPECGKKSCMSMGVEVLDQPIYELVGLILTDELHRQLRGLSKEKYEQLEFDLGGEG